MLISFIVTDFAVFRQQKKKVQEKIIAMGRTTKPDNTRDKRRVRGLYGIT